ncbi:hypothetical protein C5167_033182 [Papaver somniferum]|uniref:Uncharacterized protein n=1 Tax=Papaver somniferum TaxID=3469 RepID=A0A4Y7K9N4_PAPSO|nr:hypothetical protein C5167_033182 [Papaver somniferum]
MLSALRSRVLQSSSSSSSGIQSWKLGFNRLISSSPSPSPSPSSSYDESSGYLELEEVEKILIDVKADNIKVIPVKDQCDWTDFMVIATGRSTWHVRNIAEALIYKAVPPPPLPPPSPILSTLAPASKPSPAPIPAPPGTNPPSQAAPSRCPLPSPMPHSVPNWWSWLWGWSWARFRSRGLGGGGGFGVWVGSLVMLGDSVQGQEGGKWIVIDSGKIVVHALDEKAREYYNLEGLYTKEALAKRVPDQDLDVAFVKVRPINNSKKKKPVQKTA